MEGREKKGGGDAREGDQGRSVGCVLQSFPLDLSPTHDSQRLPVTPSRPCPAPHSLLRSDDGAVGRPPTASCRAGKGREGGKEKPRLTQDS
ncbi:hypothetical protein Pcinc_037961 [Petrolisthes cinctipes]|uniref:Uncharacterized protein n=1 Tax=Petrolisthes cinctipes TaxID=88211 RepID=A0AAE1BRK8_PETCI|nr:hypothetical protein Pcinc_037961 [Petrolisthes cinctipes]